jgi:uroporphyrinogen-III decarboxylase
MLEISARMQEGMVRMKEGAAGIADRVPVYAQISHHSARLAGRSTLQFFSDAKTFLECELRADELYGIDAPTIHYDAYNIESEALGAKLLWEEKQIPSVDTQCPLLRSVDGWKGLRPIKMGRAGRMPYVLEINRRLLDLGLSPKLRFSGLFTLAANLLGLANLILAVVTEPDKVHRLLSFLAEEVVAPWIICQREDCGRNEIATGSDAMASPPLLSVDLVREFSLAYIKKLEQQIGGIRLAGLWGESCLSDPRQLLDIKREGSPASIQVLDPDATALGPAFFRRYADQAGVALFLGLDAHLICRGPISEIEKRARRFVEEGGITGRFILLINDIPYDTPCGHVHAVVSVAREYRRDNGKSRYVASGLREEARGNMAVSV